MCREKATWRWERPGEAEGGLHSGPALKAPLHPWPQLLQFVSFSSQDHLAPHSQ